MLHLGREFWMQQYINVQRRQILHSRRRHFEQFVIASLYDQKYRWRCHTAHSLLKLCFSTDLGFRRSFGPLIHDLTRRGPLEFHVVMRPDDALPYRRPFGTGIPTAPGQLHLSSWSMMRMGIFLTVDGFVFVSVICMVMNVVVDAAVFVVVNQIWRRG